MKLTKTHIKDIEHTIKESLRKKFKSYKPETKAMPFHYRLIGKDRMALFSFIHSLNTTFGTSIFEPAAETVAQIRFETAKKQYIVGNSISEYAQKEIQEIINELSINGNPNKIVEIERIRKVCKKGKMKKLKTVKVDIFLKTKDNHFFLVDIKTAKPNISNFKDFKRTLLEWIAIFLSQNPHAKVDSFLAIPYNPYEPKPYERWTIKGMIDLEKELKVAEEFWDFLGGEGTYNVLLDCFERVGIELREEIDRYFERFRKLGMSC